MSGLVSYATLAQYHIRRGTKLADRVEPLNGRLMAKLRIASSRIDYLTGRNFQPVQATKKFDYPTRRHASIYAESAWTWQGVLADNTPIYFTDAELISLTSLVDGNNLSTNVNNVVLLGEGPYWGFELTSNTARLTYSTSRIKAISVTGVWGWHDDYASAWHDTTLTVQGGGINDSATSITLGGNPGTTADDWGQTPAISTGNLIQIDTEWLQVINTTATAITVKRGTNGTTAANHSVGAAISVYETPMLVRELCLRYGAYLEAQDSNDFDKAVITPLGGKMVAPGLPSDIEELIGQLARMSV